MFVAGLAINSELLITIGGASATIYVGSGVGQGCPASPMLFFLAFNVLLRCLGEELGATRVLSQVAHRFAGKEVLERAFMDDLSVVCRTPGHLTRAGRALHMFGRGTGMTVRAQLPAMVSPFSC